MLSSKGIIVTSAFRLVCPCALSAELRFLVKAQKVLGCSLVGSLGAARPQTNDARLFSGSALSWQYASVLASFIRTCQTYTATWGSTSGKHSLPHCARYQQCLRCRFGTATLLSTMVSQLNPSPRIVASSPSPGLIAWIQSDLSTCLQAILLCRRYAASCYASSGSSGAQVYRMRSLGQ